LLKERKNLKKYHLKNFRKVFKTLSTHLDELTPKRTKRLRKKHLIAKKNFETTRLTGKLKKEEVLRDNL